MDLDDLRRIGSAAKSSTFRLETLPQYLVPNEEEDFAAWQAGEPVPPETPESAEWLARLKQKLSSGFVQRRVHILDRPLTPYLRFELDGYLDAVAVGSEVNVVDRDAHAELADLHEDFWIIDDEIAVRMHYDEDGHFLRPELIDDIGPYREQRDLTWSLSEPVTEYLARNGLTREYLRMTG